MVTKRSANNTWQPLFNKTNMITLENKTRFFAQYWGQEVAKDKDYDEPFEINAGTISGVGLLTVEYLLLTPVSMLSDEHAIEVYRKILYDRSHHEHHNLTKDDEIEQGKEAALSVQYLKGGYCGFSCGTGSWVCDHLRSKGYALPWAGITVDEMVDAGWVKLKTY